MSQKERQMREKMQADQHQRQVRRNQVIFAILSVFLILSMVISLIHW